MTEDKIQTQQQTSISLEHLQTANEIADILGETEQSPRQLVIRVVESCGIEFARKIVARTLETEANGGLMTKDGERPRTRGGIFFYHARGDMEPSIRRRIFPTMADKAKMEKLNRQQLDWDKRQGILSKLKKTGEALDVRVKLIGTPGDIQQKSDVIVTKMLHTGGGPSIPASLPPFPEEPVNYTVYIALSQWKKVEQYIDDPDKLLEIDGMIAWDKETESLAVFTTGIKIRLAKGAVAEENSSKEVVNHAPAKPKTKPAEKQNHKARKPAEAVKESNKPKPAAQTSAKSFQIPSNAPKHIQDKIQELMNAARQYREKLSEISAKPADQQFGLEMTQKLLSNVERQIETLINMHSSR